MIELKNVSISYGPVQVVHPMSLKIEKGEFFTLLGPSGCGKTTMLRASTSIMMKTKSKINTLKDLKLDIHVNRWATHGIN